MMGKQVLAVQDAVEIRCSEAALDKRFFSDRWPRLMQHRLCKLWREDLGTGRQRNHDAYGRGVVISDVKRQSIQR